MKPTEVLMQEHKTIKLMLVIMDKIAHHIASRQHVNIEHVEKIIDFLKVFADKCHHSKEENVFFPELIKSGMSGSSGPVAVMFHEHEIGRSYIADMSTTLEFHKSGNAHSLYLLIEHIENYVILLHSHIHKEDHVLFPMADRILNDFQQNEILSDFLDVDNEIMGNGLKEKYLHLLDELGKVYFV